MCALTLPGRLGRQVWIAGLLAWGAARAEVLPAGPSAFGPGEQTSYTVKFLGVTAGVAEVTVGWPTERFGRTVWPLVCVGRTTGVATVYPVNDRFVSYWDPQTGEALGSDFLAEENRKRRVERYRYDFTALEAITTKQQLGQAPREGRYPIEPRTLDLASAAFRLRSSRLEVGEVRELPIFTGTALYQMKASVVGAERLATVFGEIDVLRVTVNGEFNGKLATRGLMTIFYTADEKQLPVRAEAEFAVGSVVLEAVKYEPGRVPSAAEVPSLSER
jgi:hypothetical protein